MSSKSVKEYIRSIREHYKKASKGQKTRLLDNFCLVTKLDRKYATKLMSKDLASMKERSGRPEKYSRDVLLPHISTLWFSMDQIGAKKMRAALPSWLPHYRGQDGTEDVPEEIKKEILKMSYSTIDRFLKLVRFQTKQKGLSTTRPGNFLMKSIPVKPLDWNVTKPGYIEADTVAHCGDDIMGEYANSVNAVDTLTTWVETRATFTKASGGVLERLKDMEECFPFSLLGFSSDNGNEFLNYNLIEHFEGRKDKPIPMKRGRPYRKNDQCRIEQKNFTHVRELFGYDRIDDRELTELMNEIYRDYWCPFQNFFIPTMKLVSKERIGARIKKKYETPKTPYQRVMDCPDVSSAYKEVLQSRYLALNPFVLRQELEKKLKTFFQLLRKKQIAKAA